MVKFPTSRVQSCWMTGRLDESISCFLIKVDPWVLVPITFRGPYVLACRGLHALAFRGLRVLIFSGLHIHTLGEYKMLNRDLRSRPPLDIGGQPTMQAHPERETIMHLLCIPRQDFTRAATKRRVRIMRTNMTNLTWIWMTLLFSNILPSDHSANLRLQMYRLGSRPQDAQWTRRSPTGPWGFQLWDRAYKTSSGPEAVQQGLRFYGVPVTSSKGIRPPTNRDFIKKYCVPRQAQGEIPPQPGDGRQRATDAPPSPLGFTSAHPQKG
ncbi:hypothetical protein HKD37_16G045199 [Glycine soja]